MSGSRSTESRDAATSPNSTTPRVVMNTVIGRRIEPSASFTAASLELDRLDPGALLETTLTDGDDAVALAHAGQDLRRVPGDSPHLDTDPGHRVAVRHEHVVLAVLGEHRAPRQDHRVLEASGAQAHAREVARPQRARRVAD